MNEADFSKSSKCEIVTIIPDIFIRYVGLVVFMGIALLFFLYLLAHIVYDFGVFPALIFFLSGSLIITVFSLPAFWLRNRLATQIVVDDENKTVSFFHFKENKQRTIFFPEIRNVLIQNTVLIVLEDEIIYIPCKIDEQKYECLSRIRPVEWGKWSRIFVSSKVRRELIEK
jgi:hypothetical protein